MTAHHDKTRPERGRWHKLVHDVGIYAIGNLGAKLITFAMVPLYTYCIPDTAQFGYFDICLTATFLLAVLVTLDLRDGAFRFLIDAPSDQVRSEVFGASYRMLAVSVTASIIIGILVLLIAPIAHGTLVLLLLLGVSFFDVYSQMVRGMGRNKVFVMMGLATALLIALLSVVCVLWLDWGIAGVFVANIVARLLPVVIVELKLRTLRHITYRVPWRPMARQLFRYSMPLVPVMITWWMLSFSDRWFVRWGAGAEANGIYAVAARFTGVIYTFAVIIQQAWQETAILQYRSADRDEFFTSIFTAFIFVLTAILIIYVTTLKCCYGWIVEQSYVSSLPLLFPMGVAAVGFSIGIFLEMGYQCSQQTSRAVPSSVATAVLSIILNVLLAPRMGTWGVIIATSVAFMFYSAYRWIDTRRYFRLRPGRHVIAPIVATGIVGCVFYLSHWWWLDVVVAMAALFALWIAAPDHLRARALALVHNKRHSQAL